MTMQASVYPKVASSSSLLSVSHSSDYTPTDTNPVQPAKGSPDFMDSSEDDFSLSMLDVGDLDTLYYNAHAARCASLFTGWAEAEEALPHTSECREWFAHYKSQQKNLIDPVNLQCINPALTWNDRTRETPISRVVSVFSGSYDEQHPGEPLSMFELVALAKEHTEAQNDNWDGDAPSSDEMDVESDVESVSSDASVVSVTSVDCSPTVRTGAGAGKTAPRKYAPAAPTPDSISMSPFINCDNTIDDSTCDRHDAYDYDSAYDSDPVFNVRHDYVDLTDWIDEVQLTQSEARVEVQKGPGQDQGGQLLHRPERGDCLRPRKHEFVKENTIIAARDTSCGTLPSSPTSTKNDGSHDIPALSPVIGSSSSSDTPSSAPMATSMMQNADNFEAPANTTPVISSSNLSIPALASSFTASSPVYRDYILPALASSSVASPFVYRDYILFADGLIVSNHGTGYRKYGWIIVEGDSAEYECSCYHRTKTPGDMTRHWQSRLHSAPEFKCGGCQRQYVRADTLKRHLRDKH
ncbi:hypothetical protein AX17_002777 [Amanita inopinata Kibby_2008]|nr:hypothetical protein AX17_002777 [Amanita inopinata Kibby_2008]